MEFKKINNLKLPVLGMGTWGIGGKLEVDTSHDKENIYAIKKAIEFGITHIDTAELYAQGHTEELVGEAISDFKRNTVFITTKVSPENLRYNDLIASAKSSLKRLKINYIDLYLVHHWNPNIPIEETMSAMDFLVRNKLIRFIGVSNFSVEQLIEAQAHTKNKIVANQIEYNLLARNEGQFTKSMEKKIIPFCQLNDIFVIAFKPLARGRLTGGFKILDDLAKKYGKTQTQIVINWLIYKKNIVTIPKSTNLMHVAENLGSIGWRLEKEDIIKLNNFKAPVTIRK